MAGKIDTSLDEPGTFMFTVEGAQRAHRLNRMAWSLTRAEGRDAFRAGEESCMDSFGLSKEEKELVRGRDWNAMLAYGMSRNLALKLAGTLGISIIEMGAAMRGETVEEFRAAGPHTLTGAANREALKNR